MKVMVVGSGGREHAIAKALLRGGSVSDVFCAPGNPGMERDGVQPVPIAASDQDALASFARREGIDFTIVGPEQPLTEGLVDRFEAEGLRAFGPTARAARIEGSKEFAKRVMAAAGVPTASYRAFTDYDEAAGYAESQGAPIVVKADGLAAGKGVVVATTVEQAKEALWDMLEDNRLGDAGASVVVEEFLEGQEFSLLAFVDGNRVYPMVIAQDHKAAYDGDLGPNTGGMGAYSPVPQISQDVVDEATEQILKPVAAQMVAQGDRFRGVLYAGLINTEEGPKVIEFNARFGDPEAQVVLPRLKSDLATVVDDLLEGREPEIEWDDHRCCVGVVVAANGYPGAYASGFVLPELGDIDSQVDVYYSGVSQDPSGRLHAAGGRIYLAQACGPTLKDAQEKVYSALEEADTTGSFYRTDIGNRGVAAQA